MLDERTAPGVRVTPNAAGSGQQSDAEKQARRILERNHALTSGDAQPSVEGEEDAGSGHTAGSRGAHDGASQGNYSSD